MMLPTKSSCLDPDGSLYTSLMLLIGICIKSYEVLPTSSFYRSSINANVRLQSAVHKRRTGLQRWERTGQNPSPVPLSRAPPCYALPRMNGNHQSNQGMAADGSCSHPWTAPSFRSLHGLNATHLGALDDTTATPPPLSRSPTHPD